VTPNKYQVPALMKASLILDMLSRKDADLAEIMTEYNLPKSSTYSLLLTLEEIGFVRRVLGGNRYTLGFRLFELGNLAVAKISIRDQAGPFLKELSRKENVTCHLGILDDNEAVYLIKVDPDDAILINSWEGKHLALTCSAMGKVLLAWLPANRQKELLDAATFTRKTPSTITSRKEFQDHLLSVKEQGWAIDNEEDIVGIKCLAAPLFSFNNDVQYSMSISGTTQKMTEERIQPLTQSLLETAGNISKALGYREDNSNA